MHVPIAWLKRCCALFALLALAACGGGGGGSGEGAKPAKVLDNFTTVTIDTGPAALSQGSDGYIADNIPYVSVTLCVPGTSTCQTIDHVTVDTGSVGLRIVRSALNAAMRDAFPQQQDASGNPVGECYGYVDGYAFGSVRSADFKIGGEAVADMPFHLVGDTGRFAAIPPECSSGGGDSLATIQEIGGNGIIGIGTTTTDCGSYCATPGGYSGAIYYDCPSSGCGAVITRAASEAAPFKQLPNPVAAMGTDRNGTILSLPAIAAGGQATASGTLTFGIGTQSNNALGSAKVLTTSTDGLLTAEYKGQSLRDSFIDSGSNLYLFVDSDIAPCTDDDFTGFYCPATPVALRPVIRGRNGASANADSTLASAKTLFNGSNAALPGIGANPEALDNLMPYPSSFDFGLPFFYGRKVYTAIAGRTAGGTLGPYVAF